MFAATAPGEPDLRLGMLAHGDGGSWQWLPLVGPDFPLALYSQRGPVVAWTPHFAGVAVRVERPSTVMPAVVPPPSRRFGRLLGLAAVALLGVNGWLLWRLEAKLPPPQAAPPPAAAVPMPLAGDAPPRDTPAADQDRLAKALYFHLLKSGALHLNQQDELLKTYDRLAADDDGLRVSSAEGRMALGALDELARRKSPRQVEATIRAVGGGSAASTRTSST